MKEAGTERDILAAEMDGQIVGQETEESEGYSISGFLQVVFFLLLFLPDPPFLQECFLGHHLKPSLSRDLNADASWQAR